MKTKKLFFLFTAILLITSSCKKERVSSRTGEKLTDKLVGVFSYEEDGTPEFEIKDTIVNGKAKKVLYFLNSNHKKVTTTYFNEFVKAKDKSEFAYYKNPESFVKEFTDFTFYEDKAEKGLYFISTKKSTSFKKEFKETIYKIFKDNFEGIDKEFDEGFVLLYFHSSSFIEAKQLYKIDE